MALVIIDLSGGPRRIGPFPPQLRDQLEAQVNALNDRAFESCGLARHFPSATATGPYYLRTEEPLLQYHIHPDCRFN